jgi:hypothetical protein
MSAPLPVEIVRVKTTGAELGASIFQGLFMTALLTLIVWWTCTAYCPWLGLTYWGLILPVFAFRFLIGRAPLGRLWGGRK